jgi:broad specificity phosphatase PhoE
MVKSMRLYLLRHAEKEKGNYFNPRLRHQDEPLSRTGKIQAENLARFFAGRDIASIYISEYVRTRQTAEPLAHRLGLQPMIDARLNEIDNGLIAQLDDDAIQRQYPEVWMAYLERNRDFRFPEGETGMEAQQRIMDFVAEMSHKSGNIFAFSHDGLLRALFCHVVGLPVYKRFDFRIDFCALLEIEYLPREAKWELVRFNQPTGQVSMPEA